MGVTLEADASRMDQVDEMPQGSPSNSTISLSLCHICCYLLYVAAGTGTLANEEVLNVCTNKRTIDSKGITIPSLRRGAPVKGRLTRGIKLAKTAEAAATSTPATSQETATMFNERKNKESIET